MVYGGLEGFGFLERESPVEEVETPGIAPSPAMREQMGAFVMPRSLEQYGQMYPEFAGGFFARDRINPNLLTTGRPQTQKELDWVLGYLGQTGQLPTTQQAAQHRGGAYIPGSTQAGLGWETPEQWRAGERRGAEFGPLFTQLPPTQAPKFQQPGFQELIDRELNPLQQYAYRVDAYLDELEQQELERIQQQYLGGVDSAGNPLPPGWINAQQQQIENKYNIEKERVTRMAQSGVDWKQLPYAEESQNMMGGLTEWYNQRIPGLMEEFYQQSPEYMEYGGQYWPTTRGPSGPGEQPERVDPSMQFATYTQSLNLAQPALDWLQGNYWNFLRMWQGSGNPNFTGWLSQYLAGG